MSLEEQEAIIRDIREKLLKQEYPNEQAISQGIVQRILSVLGSLLGILKSKFLSISITAPMIGKCIAVFCFLIIFSSTLRAQVPEVEGVPLGGGWCAICGKDMPADHDFTHGRTGGGGGPTPGLKPEPKFDPDAEARKHLNKARSHFNAGRWKEAQEAASAATRIKFELPEALYILAFSIEQRFSGLDAKGIEHNAYRWKEDALLIYRDVNRISPGYKDIRSRMKALELQVAEEDRKRQELWEARYPEIKGNRAFNSGRAFIKQKRWTDAESAFRSAVTYNPKDHEGWWNLGYSLLKLGRYRKAAEAYRKGLRLRPNEAYVYRHLAWVLERLEDYSGVVEAARGAIRLSPDDAHAHRKLGRALVKLNKHAEAETVLRKAIQLDPGEALALNDLGIALERQEKFQDAKMYLALALSQKPGDNIIRANLDRVFDGARYAQWERDRKDGRETPLSRVQDTLGDLVSSDPSVVNLRDLPAGNGKKTVPLTPAKSIYSTLKTVDVPSPQGYESESERRRRLARLSDEHIDREIKRMRRTLERMRDDFLRDSKALEEHLQETKEAEREAMMACFQTMLSGSILKWEKDWDKYPKAKMLAEKGLKYLSYEKPATEVWKDPGNVEHGMQLARNCLLDMYSIVKDFDPDLVKIKDGPPMTSFASFLVDYSYQVTRWNVAREQIKIINDTRDNPKGKIEAREAISKLQKEMVDERNRRKNPPRKLAPKGL